MLSLRIKKSDSTPSAVIALVVFGALAFYSPALKAQQTAQATPCCWPYSGISFYQYLPPGYNTNTDNYPILFFYHGIGEIGTDLTKLTNNTYSPPYYIKNGTNFPFIVISTQLKPNIGNDWWGGYMDEVVQYCLKNLRVDKTRIFISGLSLGGGGAWRYAETFPQNVAALAPLCGHYNNPAAACTSYAAYNIPVWAFHGDADTTVPFFRTQQMIDALNACTAPPMVPTPIFTIYHGVGHSGCWMNGYRPDHTIHNPNVYEWFMMQRNTSLIVNAGADVSINLPQNSTTITGVASTSTGTITTYTWTQVSGPVATLTNTTTPVVSVANLVQGVYVFRLTAANSNSETLSDDVQVTVVAANQAPTANAGADVSLTLPTNSVNIVGSGSDPDGSIASYAWTQTSGPSATIAGASSATLNLTNLIAGTYVFTLKVTDNNGATGTDQVSIVVNPAAVNQPPVVSAGADKTVNLPTSTVNITGTASDPDGSITTYLWERVSGASSAVLTNANTATLTVSALTAGLYTFRLTVTDNNTATSFDEMTVTVVAANQSPIANAGSDFSITLPTNSTNIAGSGTDPDGSISTYTWTQANGPNTATLTNASLATVSAANLIQGTYTFRLTVKDNLGASSTDDIVLTVLAAPVNKPPVANAGADQSITLPINSATFNGSGTDPDGTIASYSWSLVVGASVPTMTNASTANLSVTNLIAGSYTFRLTVTDNSAASATDDVTIVVQPAAVNQSPVANAGSDLSIVLPTNSVIINGSGNDPDGSVASYLWTQLNGPSSAVLTGSGTQTLTAGSLLQGVYNFRLTVTDNKGATGTDDVQVTVANANIAPVANAGPDATINLPTTSLALPGSGTDPDGTVASYLWTQVSGPVSATLTNAATNTLTASNLTVAGNYIFRLTVTDNQGKLGSDDVKVTVNAANLAPTANAGPDKQITLPTVLINFTGSGSDPDGTIASYAWTQVTGPSATLTNANTSTLTVTASTDGTYVFQLTVTDNGGATNFDAVQLIVNPAAVNQPPTANAGSNQTITLPVNSLTLPGSGSDPDGSIQTYSWTKVGGPSATMTNTDNPVLSLSALVEGNYTFRLTVTDNGGLSASADVTVTVLPSTVNQLPVANAGSDITLTLPLNNTTIFGSASDPDGSIASYAWTQVSGGAATLSNTTTPTLSVAGLVAGNYSFRLTVTDDKGATAFDDVTVVVNAAATNQPPVANAGADQSITLPTNMTNLIGSGSDADGSIASYSWLMVSGPTVTIGATNQPILSLSDLVEGTYVFRLSVRDNGGLTASDDVTVTVLPQTTNQSPIANAGPDKVVFLPTSTITLLGLANDPDGSIDSVRWTQIGGSSALSLVNAETQTLTVNNLIEGVFKFRLTVTDNDGATAFDEVLVTVNSATTNQPPAVSAGADITIKLPTDSIGINSTSEDFNVGGSIQSYQWTQLSGPAATLSDLTAQNLSITDMVAGTYVFSITVTDNDGATASDQVSVFVLPAALNLPPVVSAGADINVRLPLADPKIHITGTVTDDGTSFTLQWQKISGAPVTLTSDNTLDLQVENLAQGTYVFRLTATDDQGLTNSDDVKVTVYPPDPVVLPPTIDLGGDKVIQLAQDSVSADVVVTASIQSASLITSYKWSQDATPLSDTTAALSLKDLVKGTYEVSLTVEDDLGQTTTETIKITVREPNPIVSTPDIFSPDNNNQNDVWKIDNADLLNGCEISIFNRQGQKVFFSSQGYPFPLDGGWNGTYNGQPLPEGAYFYIFRCDQGKKQTGSVTIVRSKQ